MIASNAFIVDLQQQLTLSWWKPLSYRNQSIDLLPKSMDWFLYDNGLRYERVKLEHRSLFKKVKSQSILVLYITVKIGWVELTNSVNGRVGHDHFIQHELLLY